MSDRPSQNTQYIEEVCQECGQIFRFKAGKEGRPPKICRPCKNPGYAETRERYNTQRNVKRAAEKKNANPKVLTARQAEQLAAALSIIPDPVKAAALLGFDMSDDEVETLSRLAREDHGDIIDGDPSALGRKALAVMHLVASSMLANRDAIAPRDAPHAMRALSMVWETLDGGSQPSFSNVTLQVIGADGQPMTLGPSSDETEDDDSEDDDDLH